MKKALAVMLAITALYLGSAFLVSAQTPKAVTGSAKDWVAITDPVEALFSDKTFKGVGWTAYYRADGTGTLIVDGGKPIVRRWVVKGSQVCITGDATDVTGCREFQRHRKNRNEITMTNPHTKEIYTVRVEDGVPH